MGCKMKRGVRPPSVRRQCHPRVQIPSLRQTRLLGANREHRICTVSSEWVASIGVVPGAAWHGSSSERRRHVPGAALLWPAVIHLGRDLHAIAGQLFVISFQNYQSWPSHLFLLGNLEKKPLHFTIS